MTKLGIKIAASAISVSAAMLPVAAAYANGMDEGAADIMMYVEKCDASAVPGGSGGKVDAFLKTYGAMRKEYVEASYLALRGKLDQLVAAAKKNSWDERQAMALWCAVVKPDVAKVLETMRQTF